MKISNLIYADDNMVMAKNEKDFNTRDTVYNYWLRQKYGMKISAKKTKTMIINKKENEPVTITDNREKTYRTSGSTN